MWFSKKKTAKTEARPCSLKNEEGKCALIAPGGNGNPLTPFIYDAISPLQTDGLSYYHCTNDGKQGLLELNGDVIIPCEMDVMEVDRNIIMFKQGDKWGLYATHGVLVMPMYDEINELDSFVHVRLGDEWGFLDLEEGKFMTEEEDSFEKGMLMFF